jgi:aspartokinase
MKKKPASHLPITKIIEQEVRLLPHLDDLMQIRLINMSALALVIQSKLENKHGIKATKAAIGMALRRNYQPDSKRKKFSKTFPKHIDITTRSGIYELGIRKNEPGLKAVEKISKLLSLKKDLLITITGNYEIVFIANQKSSPVLNKYLTNCEITSERKSLGFITVNWPESTKNIPGIYYRITQAIAWQDISIQSFHTIGSEMMILVESSQLLKTHQTITELLTES